MTSSSNPKDTLKTHVPSHIVDEYPKFVQFLEGYYEWLSQEGNPYERIKHHMDYVSFDKSLDAYIDMMKEEYLSRIPQNVIGDKQKFIEWSRKMNLARGSHESYKFLFKMLFNEQTTEIYLPKDNILKTSDGVWISGQSNMLITNSGDSGGFLYRKIYQQRERFAGKFDYAEAVVDSFRIRYINGFNVIELTLTNIIGEFLPTHKVFNDAGQEEWPIYTISEFDIIDGGQDYFENNELQIAGFDPTYQLEFEGDGSGKIDTRVSTSLRKSQLSVTVDGAPLDESEYSYDGRFITSDLIVAGSDAVFSIDIAHEGSFIISRTDGNGAIRGVTINSLPILVNQDYSLENPTNFGSGLNIVAKRGLVTPIPGYYADDRGQLSTQMYLQDSDYYQDYSYVIKTEQDIQKYADVVRDVLHPAGFKFFGNIRLISILESIINPIETGSGIFVQQTVFETLARYSLGGNYSLFGKIGPISPRVYNGDEWDSSYVTGDLGYTLQDEYLERTLDENGDPLEIDTIGWMTKQNLEYFDIHQPQDYFEDDLHRGMYVEDNFVLTVNMDEQSFIDTYINTYMVFDYNDTDYSN